MTDGSILFIMSTRRAAVAPRGANSDPSERDEELVMYAALEV